MFITNFKKNILVECPFLKSQVKLIHNWNDFKRYLKFCLKDHQVCCLLKWEVSWNKLIDLIMIQILGD